MPKIKKLIEFLKEKFPNGIQMFNTKNWIGDSTCNIYDEDGIQVDWCIEYDYLEIFGLTEEEFEGIIDYEN